LAEYVTLLGVYVVRPCFEVSESVVRTALTTIVTLVNIIQSNYIALNWVAILQRFLNCYSVYNIDAYTF
jgi:hypothetical protein